MCSRFHRNAAPVKAAALLSFVLTAGVRAGEPRTVRFCVEPNNLPFSNQRGEGFENKLAVMLAEELQAEPRFVWWAQRRGYVRHTVLAGRCDVLVSIPAGTPSVLTSRPYYRSSFALLAPANRDLNSLDDPRLKNLRIGLHVVGDDYIPPGHVLAARGLQANLVGFQIYGEAGEEEPAGKLVRALEDGRIDVAVLWGPFAGYFARRRPGALRVIPVWKSDFAPQVPLTFAISLGVHPGNQALLGELNAALIRRGRDVAALLAEYGVPVAP